MTAPRPRQGRRDDRDLLRQLARGVEAPDLTGPIMDRLGYERIGARDVRRRRRRRLLDRGATTMAILLAIGAGLAALHLTGAARRPTGPTIPAALGHDLQLHQERVSEALRSIRERTERRWPAALPAPGGEDDDRRPAPLDDDVDRSALAAVSWV